MVSRSSHRRRPSRERQFARRRKHNYRFENGIRVRDALFEAYRIATMVALRSLIHPRYLNGHDGWVVRLGRCTYSIDLQILLILEAYEFEMKEKRIKVGSTRI